MPNGQRKRIHVTIAAVRLRMSRERVIRHVQMGKLAGGRDEAGWYVDASALERAVREQQQESAAATVPAA